LRPDLPTPSRQDAQPRRGFGRNRPFNQMNPTNPANRLNLMNRMNRANPMSPMNLLNPANPMNPINQMNLTHHMTRLNDPMNPMNPNRTRPYFGSVGSVLSRGSTFPQRSPVWGPLSGRSRPTYNPFAGPIHSGTVLGRSPNQIANDSVWRSRPVHWQTAPMPGFKGIEFTHNSSWHNNSRG
jgi:hypothetical protein